MVDYKQKYGQVVLMAYVLFLWASIASILLSIEIQENKGYERVIREYVKKIKGNN